jgi:Tol biopolymer transport system component
VPVTRVDVAQQEASHRWPQLLSDGRHFVYFVQATAPGTHGIYLADLGGSAPPRRLLTSPLGAVYVPPDYLLFVSDEALLATRFDWEGVRVRGEPLPIVSPVAGNSNFYAALTASHTGLLAYASSSASAELVWLDRTGRRVGSVGAPGEYADFRLSPQNDQLAVAEVDAQSHRPDIRVLDFIRGGKVRLTFDPATDASPVWSPDGKRLVFRSNPFGIHDLFEKAANGAGPRTPLLQTPSAKYPTDWMPNGRGVIYHTYEEKTGADIWMVTPDGSRATPLVQTAFDEFQGQVSADGRWLAYTSLETRAAEVYIADMSDPSTRWQVSAGGGTDPRWRRDGGELFYISADSWLTSVEFTGGVPAPPRRLFQVRVAPPLNPYLSNYDVTSDGQRFLVKVPVHDVASSPIYVVTNWLNARRGT